MTRRPGRPTAGTTLTVTGTVGASMGDEHSYRCGVCEEKFDSEAELRRHLRDQGLVD